MLKPITVLILASAIATSSMQANADGPEAIAFLIKQAHEKGFAQCDAGIRDTFKLVSGADVRAVTDSPATPGFKEMLQMTAISGDDAVSVVTEAVLVSKGGKCFIFSNSHLATKESCTAYAAQSPAFKFDSESYGVVMTRNNGNTRMLLQSVGTGCEVHYETSNAY